MGRCHGSRTFEYTESCQPRNLKPLAQRGRESGSGWGSAFGATGNQLPACKYPDAVDFLASSQGLAHAPPTRLRAKAADVSRPARRVTKPRHVSGGPGRSAP